jgi:hypothetical protein
MRRFYGPSALAAALLASPTFAQDYLFTTEGMEDTFTPPSYSPYAGRSFPTELLWGDTHLHTNLSLDARSAGVILSPEDAFRFARGDEITTSGGIRVRIGQPLDFLVVTDHSDAMGAMNEVVAGNPTLLTDPTVRDWHQRIIQGGDVALDAGLEVVEAFSQGNTPEILLSETFAQSIWEQATDAADAFDDPGKFSAIIGRRPLGVDAELRGSDRRARARDPAQWKPQQWHHVPGREPRDEPASDGSLCPQPHALGAALRGHADQGRRRSASAAIAQR